MEVRQYLDMATSQFDCVLIGGGLQNALSALALTRFQPRLRVALVERVARLGGNHTWCFHSGDVAESALAFVEPLVVRRWDGYSVRFPGYERDLDEVYAMVTSSRCNAILVLGPSAPLRPTRLG